MKNYSVKLMVGFWFAFLFYKDVKALRNPEWTPPYHITSSKKDTALKNTEAIFTFKFLDQHTGKNVLTDIKMSYNGKNLTAKKDENGKFSLLVKPGNYLFKFFYDTDHYEMTTDSISVKPGYRTEIEVRFQSSKYPTVCTKPVIYVYPKEKTEVSIKLEMKGKLGFTYPEYKTGWNFVVDSSGTIEMDGKKFNYLFWEGETDLDGNKINFNEGFIVNKNDLTGFFEEKLSAMGLNSKESADYITYWVPLMSANEKNYVHFVFNEDFNEYAKLTITPKPDHVFRVFMVWANAAENNFSKLTEQKIPSLDRKGFTVLEWGGMQKEINLNQ
ncbi:MAG: hypothetical protein IAF38_17440 [Bacteroidia bacterium]|nr:hypothetical protein [Bacteroidia bacterium]